MKNKVIFYSDELNDDFAPTKGKIRDKKITEKYNYLHEKNFLWQVAAFFWYRIIATPVAYLYMYLFKGLRVKNKKALKKIKGGFFLYGNHTQLAGDAFAPSIISFPKKAHILVASDSVAIPIIGLLTHKIGALPLPDDLGGMRNFLKALSLALQKKRVITVYPEAHIWPYYNKIRPFKDTSFAYPLKYNVACAAFVVVYRKRKIFKKLPPKPTVVISEPIYPQQVSGKAELRDKIYRFMSETAQKEASYEYIKYVYKEKEQC